MRLQLAEGAILEEILDLTYDVWHEGLTRSAYGRWNVTQMQSPWGRERLQRVALVDEKGDLLASAKRYRFDMRLDGRDVAMCGVGALFTSPQHGGHGYGAALMEQLLEAARTDGQVLAALFSEIGDEYYRRLAFEPAPIEEVTVEVIRKGGAPAMLVRAGDVSDLPALAAMHDVRASAARLALRRDPAMIGHAIAKRRLFAGLSPPGLRQTEFFVAEEGATAVAYVVITVSPGGWTIEEAGDNDPAAARLEAMLQVLMAREPSSQPPLIRAWWPRALPEPPQLRLVKRGPSRDLFMVRSLTKNLAVSGQAEDVYFWHGDAF